MIPANMAVSLAEFSSPGATVKAHATKATHAAAAGTLSANEGIISSVSSLITTGSGNCRARKRLRATTSESCCFPKGFCRCCKGVVDTKDELERVFPDENPLFVPQAHLMEQPQRDG